MHEELHFLNGGGAMAQCIRDHDWSAHALGPPANWPAALKVALSMALNSKFPKCIVWGPGLITFHNDAFQPILGDKRDVLGSSFADIWSDVWDKIGPLTKGAMAGEAVFIEDYPLILDRSGYPEQCNFTFCYSPIRDEQGVVRGMMNTVVETSEKVEARRKLQLLNDELGHRIKNMLTVVSAIINQTLQSHSGDEAHQHLRQRIGVLAEAQTLLSASDRLEADIGKVIDQALAPFRSGMKRFRIAGPKVQISTRQALTLALAINELATNALKYGALSNAEGTVDLSWVAGMPHSSDAFILIWLENGGPPVVPRRGKGFGSLIIEDVLAQDFMGDSLIRHDLAGIRYELHSRMMHLGTEPGS